MYRGIAVSCTQSLIQPFTNTCLLTSQHFTFLPSLLSPLTSLLSPLNFSCSLLSPPISENDIHLP
jgi:hypothetical protein